MDLEFYKKFDNWSDSELANYYVDLLVYNCPDFKLSICVLCRFYKKCSYEMGVQKYCERKLKK